MSLLASMDRFVHATRLDILTPSGRRPARNLRWLPLPILIGMPAGYALLIAAIHRALPLRWGIVGSGLFGFGFIAANVLRLFGPVPETGQPPDERERMVKARAGSISGAAIAVLAVLGCFYFGAVSALGGWMPHTPFDWIFLGLILQGWAFALPVLVASWLQPKPVREEE